MRIVLLDSAGPVVGVAAFLGGDCVAAETATLASGADGWLTPAISRALAALDRLDAVAVVVGPGAFTGLRVGLAHALGLAFARGLPILPLSTLALRAAAAPGHASVLALLDARKARVYAQRFDTRGPVPVPVDCPQDIDMAVLIGAGLPAGTVAVGEGIGVALDLLVAGGVSPLSGADDRYLRAAGPSLAVATPKDPAFVEPFYLREPDAVGGT
ncbi:MAG: tRNA (adenosine(37)-N6)-threonylcarbamoyltransferase complex dimerization subunit type 1 TsaB [Myxococcales bacterium]|nr:tRNA (adenosine(37)-N6)-threonylcarbamoyltransferase complex dimerization subunit type 1 TsaB [Myxococcales bacterium]